MKFTNFALWKSFHDIYIDHILRFLNKGMMIALTGQRRVGKSYVLRELAEIIRKN